MVKKPPMMKLQWDWREEANTSIIYKHCKAHRTTGTAVRKLRVAVYCSPWSICSQFVSRRLAPWSLVSYGVPFRWWNIM